MEGIQRRGGIRKRKEDRREGRGRKVEVRKGGRGRKERRQAMRSGPHVTRAVLYFSEELVPGARVQVQRGDHRGVYIEASAVVA